MRAGGGHRRGRADPARPPAGDPGRAHRPCTFHRGVDGSHVFRGGVGHSLVIDPDGRLWRALSHEDFLTTWDITPPSCTIATLEPLYAQMREYRPRDGSAAP